MATTITLDDDTAARLKAEATRRRLTPVEFIRNLLPPLAVAATAPLPVPFKVRPMRGEFQPGVDPENPRRFLDSAELEEFLARSARPAPPP